MESRISLAWLDDRQLLRQTVRPAFSESSGISLVLESSLFDDFVARLETLDQLDVALLDIELDGQPHLGTDAIQSVRARFPECRIAVLTKFAKRDNAYLGNAVDAGVRGFISKEDPLEAIIDAIRRLHHGTDLIVTSPAAREPVERLLWPKPGDEDVWHWFDEKSRPFLIEIARSGSQLRAEFTSAQNWHKNTVNQRIETIKNILIDHGVLEEGADLRFEWLREWARQKHFDLRS